MHTKCHLDEIRSSQNTETAHFDLFVDPVTYIKVKGHQQWYPWLEVQGGYKHTKFEKCRYISDRENGNVKILDTAGRQTDGRTTDGRTDRRTLIIT